LELASKADADLKRLSEVELKLKKQVEESDRVIADL